MKNTVKKIYNQLITLSSTSVLLFTFGYSSQLFSADYPEAGSFSNGSKVWAENCNRCHNMRGPKELRDDQWISTSFHMRGRGGLTGQETRDVITFLQASNTKSVATGVSTNSSTTADSLQGSADGKGVSGKETYEKTCVACHSANGEGAFPGTPDFTDSSGALSKSDSVLFNHINNGFQSEGSPMAMPAKGGNPSLSNADVKNVLNYIRETFGQ